DVAPEVRSTIGRRLRTSGIGPRRACCAMDIEVVEVNRRLSNKPLERVMCRRIGRSADQ
ncbi:unnamed protein product, partial [Musa textilis]